MFPPVPAYVHEPGVVLLVVDAVRDGVRLLPVREVVGPDGDGISRGRPLAAVLPEVPDLLPFLGIHADHRVPGLQVPPRPRGDMPELPVPLRVLPSFLGPGVRLLGEAHPPQHPPGRGVAARVPGGGQLARQVLRAAGRPYQRRFRVPAHRVPDQLLQRRGQAGIGLRQRLAAAAGPALAARRRLFFRIELGLPVCHRLPRRPGQGRHPARPSLSLRLGSHPEYQAP